MCCPLPETARLRCQGHGAGLQSPLDNQVLLVSKGLLLPSNIKGLLLRVCYYFGLYYLVSKNDLLQYPLASIVDHLYLLFPDHGQQNTFVHPCRP